MYGVNTGSPFVIPRELGIGWPVIQPQDLQTYQTSESRPPLSLLSLSASSSTLMLTRIPTQFSSSSSSIDRSSSLTLTRMPAPFSSSSSSISPPSGEDLLPPPAVVCLISSLEDPNTARRHEPCPESESPCTSPALRWSEL